MRTTLELDDRVLALARSQVAAGHFRSIGEAVSALALAGLAGLDGGAPAPRTPTADGLVLLPTDPAHTITADLVARALHDD